MPSHPEHPAAAGPRAARRGLGPSLLYAAGFALALAAGPSRAQGPRCGEQPAAPRAPSFAVQIGTGTQSAWLAASSLKATLAASSSLAIETGAARLRIGVWGDSHTASRSFVDGLLSAWGLAPEQALPSLLVPALNVPGVRQPWREACVGPGWTLRQAHRSRGAAAQFDAGLMQLASDTAGSWWWIDFGNAPAHARPLGVTLHLAKERTQRTLMLAISVDGLLEHFVSLSDPEARAVVVRAAAPISTLRVRLVAGQASFSAIAPHWDRTPETQVDLFSVPGATADGWQQVRGEPVRPAGRGYDLVFFQYGTNEAMERSFEAEVYERDLRSSLARFRAALGRTRCVMIGPPDRASALYRDLPAAQASVRHARIALIQRRVARDASCTFWDWQSAMGGIGSGARWLAAQPALMQADGVHLTTAGYERSGALLAQSLPRPTR